MVAELGAVFRVELKDGGWQCSVKTGRRTEVLEDGLETRTEGKARAEAHAARMPEVARACCAREDDAPAKERTRRGTGRKTAKRAKREPRAAKQAADAAPPAASATAPSEPTGASSELTYQKLDDGCLFGRAAGACWVASDKDVVFARPVDPALEATVRELAAQHFTKAREAKKAEREAARAEREAERAAARAEREAARTAAKVEREASKTTRTTRTKKAAAKKTTKTAAKKTAKKGPRGRKGKAAGKSAAEKEGEPVAKKTNAKDTAPAATWTEKGGEQRFTAVHGTFLIQPEGERAALYFYEPGGQSRHLRSGDAKELRKAAEEMAARGQPAPEREAISADKEEAMLRMFVSGAVEGV